MTGTGVANCNCLSKNISSGKGLSIKDCERQIKEELVHLCFLLLKEILSIPIPNVPRS
jgi:hypothetical protein